MIEYIKENHIAKIIINRPESLGAITIKGFEELHNALIDFRDDDNLLVGIITGTGDKAFCSGVDIKDMLPFIKKTSRKPWMIPPTMMRGLDLWKPLIAALNGLTIGIGLEIAISCDIRIASDNAKFGLPEVKIGIFPGSGGTQRLQGLIPRGMAAEMIFTGKLIDTQEAYRIGLINKIVSLNELMSTANELAESICQGGPIAIRAAKECMIRGASLGMEAGLILENTLTQRVVYSNDFEEGVTAFIEKRTPKFTGK